MYSSLVVLEKINLGNKQLDDEACHKAACKNELMHKHTSYQVSSYTMDE